MTNDETDSIMAPPWWRISSSSGRRHGDIDDGDDDTDDDTDDDHDHGTDDDNDHKNESYIAVGAAPGASILFSLQPDLYLQLDLYLQPDLYL